jgi:hypothetical protein
MSARVGAKSYVQIIHRNASASTDARFNESATISPLEELDVEVLFAHNLIEHVGHATNDPTDRSHGTQ